MFREAAEAKPLNPFLKVLEPYLPGAGLALDLGCGTGRNAVWLAEHGLMVDAVDNDPESLALCRERADGNSLIKVVDASFLQFDYQSYDLVLALFSVFFNPRPDFSSFWPKVVESIKPGGLFAGQLLGPHDDWADGETSFHTRREVDDLFDGFTYLHFEEIERDGKTVWDEPKRWHIYHLVARKVR
ncbi:MAG: class I SAM-dependent methyltransferase [Armatimonadetes bacterium]|nr:class I SAM-dependent methyltransferase [Armatimonadota bacterium]